MNIGPNSLIYSSFHPCNLTGFMQNLPSLTQEKLKGKSISKVKPRVWMLSIYWHHSWATFF